MKYMVATGESGEALSEEVNKLNQRGWRPFGGVSVAALESSWDDRKADTHTETNWVFAQAMTKA